MKSRYLGIGFLLVFVMLIASCDLIPPDLALRVVNPSYAFIDAGTNVRITFQLYNSGSERLYNCKVKWYVDDFDSDASDADIEYDELTVWAPGTGVDLAVDETSSPITIDTTSGIFGLGVNFYGIYEMGWDSPSTE